MLMRRPLRLRDESGLTLVELCVTTPFWYDGCDSIVLIPPPPPLQPLSLE